MQPRNTAYHAAQEYKGEWDTVLDFMKLTVSLGKLSYN